MRRSSVAARCYTAPRMGESPDKCSPRPRHSNHPQSGAIVTDCGIPKTTTSTARPRQTTCCDDPSARTRAGPILRLLAAAGRRCSKEPDASPLGTAVMQTTPMLRSNRIRSGLRHVLRPTAGWWKAPRGRDAREPHEGARCHDEPEVPRPRNKSDPRFFVCITSALTRGRS
jgi:hypothetical protein